MTSVMSNGVLAFLESDRGGTLADLRRFLVEAGFPAGGRRRPTPDGHMHVPVAAAQRSRVLDRRDSCPSFASRSRVTAVEVGNRLKMLRRVSA